MFSWDDAKNRANQRKHGVSFELASLVFDDPRHLTRQDRIENGERRWQTLGLVGGVVVLLVAHTVHEEADGGETLRLISARRATAKERRIYDEQST